MFLVAPVYAGDLVVGQFSGLNTQDPPATLQPYESQDLLNVNIQPGMKAVIKRDGYGLFKSLPISCSTCAVHGGYHFQQTGGNDVQLWGNDVELSGSVNDATFVKLATGTVGATWQCTDNLGFAYCLTSSNDTVVKTDGSVANTSYQDGTIPKGTIIASTPLQLLVGGTSASPSTINFSANNNFTNFTTGPLPTDPFTEIINAPGSRITHLAYYFGKVFWWKDQSFGYISGFGNQNTVNITIVSNQIGTLDNSSTFWNGTTFESENKFSSGASPNGQMLGGIFFRGQDNHIYLYDGYSLTRITRVIAPTITASNRRKSNLWTQTSQSDFNGGAVSPVLSLSTASVSGSVTTSSFSVTETGSASWSSGSTSNATVGTSSISIAINNSGNVTDSSFENASITTAWTKTTGAGSGWASSPGAGLSGACASGTLNPQSGSRFAIDNQAGCADASRLFAILDANTSAVLDSASFTPGSCTTWAQSTITPSSANIGKRVKVKITHTTACGSNSITTQDSYILGGNITLYSAIDTTGGTLAVDNIQNGSSTVTTGSFASRAFNTGSPYSFVYTSATWTVNTSTPSFVLQKSAAGTDPWTDISYSTGVNVQTNQRYLRYLSTFTLAGTDNALSSLTGVQIIAQSSGTYYSAWNNAPNLTAWGILNVAESNGDGGQNFFVRSSTSPQVVLNSTVPWVSQGINSTIVASTGTYFQLIDSFTITAATNTAPSLSDFTFNWTEGTASDKAYITYFNDHIWIAESSGTVSTDNVIYRLDLLNNAWLQDNIASNGFLIENNSLYFGDPVQGRVFKFGSVPTDNGNSIYSYWKSKDFAGDDPTVQNEYMQADFLFNSVSSTATYTYTLDQSSATAISLSLYSTASNTVRRGLLLARGRIGTFYNFMVGDNSSNAAWKLLMHRVHYNALNWRGQTN